MLYICPVCKNEEHSEDAEYCKICGHEITKSHTNERGIYKFIMSCWIEFKNSIVLILSETKHREIEPIIKGHVYRLGHWFDIDMCRAKYPNAIEIL